MADRIELAFRRAVDPLLPAGSRVLVAVSGGGDSVALLHLVTRAAARRDWQVSVAHLDHGLREGSDGDRRFVAALARRLGLRVTAARRSVKRLRRRDESPEEAARRVRRGFLLEAARRVGAQRIALGHTLDDQAETVLMRLIRGAGATALTGMAARGPGPFVRPLLGLERDDLRAWLRRKDLDHLDDPSNRDLRFDRNRIRLLLLPLLRERFNAGAARALVRAAQRFRDDALYLDDEAASAARRIARTDRGRLALDARELVDAAPPLAQRVVRASLARCGIDPRRITATHVAAVLDLAQGPRGRVRDLPGRRRARRTATRVLLESR